MVTEHLCLTRNRLRMAIGARIQPGHTRRAALRHMDRHAENKPRPTPPQSSAPSCNPQGAPGTPVRVEMRTEASDLATRLAHVYIYIAAAKKHKSQHATVVGLWFVFLTEIVTSRTTQSLSIHTVVNSCDAKDEKPHTPNYPPAHAVLEPSSAIKTRTYRSGCNVNETARRERQHPSSRIRKVLRQQTDDRAQHGPDRSGELRKHGLHWRSFVGGGGSVGRMGVSQLLTTARYNLDTGNLDIIRAGGINCCTVKLLDQDFISFGLTLIRGVGLTP